MVDETLVQNLEALALEIAEVFNERASEGGGGPQVFRGDWSSSQLAYSQDFAGGVLPTGWSSIPNVDNGASVRALSSLTSVNRPSYINAAGSSTGNFNGYGGPQVDLALIPELAGKNPTTLTYWHASERVSGSNPSMRVLVNDAVRETITSPTDAWVKRTVVLSGLQRIGFPNLGYSSNWVTGIEVYVAADPYMIGQFVVHAGSLWRSLVNNNSAEPGADPTKWGLALESGSDLPDGTVVYRGVWADDATGAQYLKGHLVRVEDHLYMALLDGVPGDTLADFQDAGDWYDIGSGATGGGGGGGGGADQTFVFYDDDTSSYTRPNLDTPVVFYGSVQPGAEMLDGDSWFDTSEGDPTPGGYLVWITTGTPRYPARADSQPVTFVGPTSPLDLGIMVDGDVWINTTTAPYSATVYVTSGDVDTYVANLVALPASATAIAVTALINSLVSSKLPQDVTYAKPSAAHVSLDEFASALTVDWNRVETPGTDGRLQWAQGAGALHWAHAGGDSASQIHTLLRAGALAVGECWETRMSYQGNASPQMFGLAVSDGLAVTNGVVMAAQYSAGVTAGFNTHMRQQSSYTVALGDGAAIAPATSILLGNQDAFGIHVRLKRVSGGFEMHISRGGVLWTRWSSVTNALVPTYVGFFVSSWGTAQPFNGVFEYLRKIPA